MSQNHPPEPAGGGTDLQYRDRVAAIEPYGVDAIPDSERHGRPISQFFIWFAAGMNFPIIVLGFVAVSFGRLTRNPSRPMPSTTASPITSQKPRPGPPRFVAFTTPGRRPRPPSTPCFAMCSLAPPAGWRR